MAGPSMELALGGKGPLIPNAGGTGYYRFELPQRDWDALIRKSDRLPGGEAQALVDSLVASFQAGRASAGQITELARRMPITRTAMRPMRRAMRWPGSIAPS